MGYLMQDLKNEKHIEITEKTDNKIKHKSYEKIKDIVMGKSEDIKTSVKTGKNNNLNKKPVLDIGLSK